MVFVAFLLLGVERSHTVEFSYSGPEAKKVQIAGDFDAWSSLIDMSKEGDKWVKKVELPDNGRIEYKFVVDGNWVLDSTNPNKMANGIGGENSVWQGPSYRFLCRDFTPKHPMTRFSINVKGRVIVGYAPRKSDNLPIIAYGDGDNYEATGKVQNVLENLVEAGKARQAVIVLIPPSDRMKEYGRDWKSYGEYVFNDVLPAVRKVTHASSNPKDVFMGGSSMGGLISLRLAEEFPEKIAGGIQCQSSSIQWAAMDIKLDDVSSIDNLKRIAPSTRISLDWGTFEDTLTKANERLANNLKSMHRPFLQTVTPEGHTWTAWRNRMEAGLTYLLNSNTRSVSH